MKELTEIKYKLTCKCIYSHHDKDGKDRNYIYYYLNDILILKQKIPFDTRWEEGFDRITSIYDVYILNGKLYQKRRKYYGCCHPDNDKTEIREVSFPLSKKKLLIFNIPFNLKIEIG